uniref:Uncharacterized protein n=1 Tax=Romanomermis culicivorax TaxID=13658 RepID=A0A915HG58_ROMCU
MADEANAVVVTGINDVDRKGGAGGAPLGAATECAADSKSRRPGGGDGTETVRYAFETALDKAASSAVIEPTRSGREENISSSTLLRMNAEKIILGVGRRFWQVFVHSNHNLIELPVVMLHHSLRKTTDEISSIRKTGGKRYFRNLFVVKRKLSRENVGFSINIDFRTTKLKT